MNFFFFAFQPPPLYLIKVSVTELFVKNNRRNAMGNHLNCHIVLGEYDDLS